MLFNSLNFAIFLPIIFILYWFAVKGNLRLQNILLLVSSYFFYACWDWRFLFLLIFSTLLDFFTGIKMSDAQNQDSKKKWFLLSVSINLGFLGFFKYYNFFIESFCVLLTEFGLKPNIYTLKVILPVGISFYTFHGLSYIIDIYRSRIKAERNFMQYSVFVCFFPLLIAGPIERATHLLPQIKSKRTFSNSIFNEGIIQIIVGLFRKIVIADSLAKYVDNIYGNPEIHNSSALMIATIFYAFQIYYDFSGYSDIAIGTAKLFGFELFQNFKLPYFSTSLTEFWRRWHMSLSFWLRDYLYIELGGNRLGILKTYRNLFLTMLLGGLWHGSNWTFIVWGGIHGFFLGIEKYFLTFSISKHLKKISFIGYAYTFIVACFAWIYFRSTNVFTANKIVVKILSANFSKPSITDVNIMINSIVVLFVGIIFDLYLRITKQDLEHFGQHLTIQKIVLFITISLILIFIFYSSSNNFIYFQF